MIDERFAFVGALINLSGTMYYVVAVLRRRVRPNRMTWSLWALAPLITFAAQLSEGVGVASTLTLAVGVGPIFVILASFISRDAYWAMLPFDWACGSLSVSALVLWWFTGSGAVAVALSIVADAFAALPTLVKAWRRPETENTLAYVLGSVGAFTTLLSVDALTFESAAFALYVTITMGTIAFLASGWRRGGRARDAPAAAR